MRSSRCHKYPKPRRKPKEIVQMDKHETQIARGEEASRILNSAVFADAFEAVKATYIEALTILPTDASGDEEAKDIRRKLASLTLVRDALTKHIQTGQIAEKSLREKLMDRGRTIRNLASSNRSR